MSADGENQRVEARWAGGATETTWTDASGWGTAHSASVAPNATSSVSKTRV